MKTLVRVTAQYLENYSDSNNKLPNWKAKGKMEFNVYVELGILMYDKESFVHAISDLLASATHSNDHARFNYVSHEPVFHAPITIDQESFDKMLDDYTGPDTKDPETATFSAMQGGNDGG